MGTKHGCPLSTFLFKIFLETLARAIRQTKEIKGLWKGKEELMLSLFADDMILYLEDPKNSTSKLVEQMNEFSKVAGYKINMRKSNAFLFISDESSEREIRKTTVFTIPSKKVQYLVINLKKRDERPLQ